VDAANVEAPVALHKRFEARPDDRVLIGNRDLNLGGHRRHEPPEAAIGLVYVACAFDFRTGVMLRKRRENSWPISSPEINLRYQYVVEPIMLR
jgi:hypothetical protein